MCCFDRYLRYLDYEVRYVRNFTDIDDKVIFRQIYLHIYVKLSCLFLLTKLKNDVAVIIFLHLCCLQDIENHSFTVYKKIALS
jgi:cysteinyl-tRNA synthetase